MKQRNAACVYTLRAEKCFAGTIDQPEIVIGAKFVVQFIAP